MNNITLINDDTLISTSLPNFNHIWKELRQPSMSKFRTKMQSTLKTSIFSPKATWWFQLEGAAPSWVDTLWRSWNYVAVVSSASACSVHWWASWPSSSSSFTAPTCLWLEWPHRTRDLRTSAPPTHSFRAGTSTSSSYVR